MDGGDLWLASETCLDVASNVDREEACSLPRQRADATWDGVSPSHRISRVLGLLGVGRARRCGRLGGRRCGSKRFSHNHNSTRIAFLPLSQHNSLFATYNQLVFRQLIPSPTRQHSLRPYLLPRTLTSPESPSCGQARLVKHGTVSVETSPKPREFQATICPPVANPVTSHYRRKKAKKILDMI